MFSNNYTTPIITVSELILWRYIFSVTTVFHCQVSAQQDDQVHLEEGLP